MLRIRLRRTGAKKQPRYRVVVAESRAPRDGAFVEILGWYNPQADPPQIVIDTDKTASWVQRGARPSESAASLIRRAEAARAAAEAPAVPEKPPRRSSRRQEATAEPSAATEEIATATAAAAAKTSRRSPRASKTVVEPPAAGEAEESAEGVEPAPQGSASA